MDLIICIVWTKNDDPQFVTININRDFSQYTISLTSPKDNDVKRGLSM